MSQINYLMKLKNYKHQVLNFADPMNFWNLNNKEFPVLAKLARKI
jgi:hypothetical protein